MHTLVACIFLFCYSQNKPIVTCGQKEITEKLFRENPSTLQFHQTVEKQLLAFTKARKALNNVDKIKVKAQETRNKFRVPGFGHKH
jgi:hypothetical protein